MASWHRVSGDRREFWKGLVEWKESRGSETNIFSFYVVFFLRLIFSLELAGTLRCRRLSPRRKICNTPLWKRNHQNLLNLLNYSNTYSNHFLHAAWMWFSYPFWFHSTLSSCSQRPITIHCPSMTHAQPSSLSLPSALCCPEVFSSRFYESIWTMFSTLVRIWFLHGSKVFFFWGASRHLWQRFCVAVFDLALQGWHTVTLTHTPRRHKRHRILHKTTRQAWLKSARKYEKTRRMFEFSWIWFLNIFDVYSFSMGLFGQFMTIMSLSFCFYRLNR